MQVAHGGTGPSGHEAYGGQKRILVKIENWRHTCEKIHFLLTKPLSTYWKRFANIYRCMSLAHLLSSESFQPIRDFDSFLVKYVLGWSLCTFCSGQTLAKRSRALVGRERSCSRALASARERSCTKYSQISNRLTV